MVEFKSIFGRRQAVRHRTLTPTCVSSNLTTPANSENPQIVIYTICGFLFLFANVFYFIIWFTNGINKVMNKKNTNNTFETVCTRSLVNLVATEKVYNVNRKAN